MAGRLSLADAITMDRLRAQQPELLIRARSVISTPVVDCDRFAIGLKAFALVRYGYELPPRTRS